LDGGSDTGSVNEYWPQQGRFFEYEQRINELIARFSHSMTYSEISEILRDILGESVVGEGTEESVVKLFRIVDERLRAAEENEQTTKRYKALVGLLLEGIKARVPPSIHDVVVQLENYDW
jgi:hypothetical protein